MTDFHEAIDSVYEEAKNVLCRKHEDYGPLNISQAPGGPLNGLRVRMWDKLARINNLVDQDREAVNEPLRDSLLDLLNYAAIGLLVLDGDWPGVELAKKRLTTEEIVERAEEFVKRFEEWEPKGDPTGRWFKQWWGEHPQPPVPDPDPATEQWREALTHHYHPGGAHNPGKMDDARKGNDLT